MTRINERMIESDLFKRRKATEDTKRKIVGWEIWECAEPSYSNDYDRTVTLYVHHGVATLTFDDGKGVDLQTGDLLTIQQGASAIWKIFEPIRNSYMYHDSFQSASNRTAQVYGSGQSGKT